MNREARGCRRGANEVHHDLVGFQRMASPIAGHMTKQAMLDLVPLARAGREMAHFDLQTGFIAQRLQFDLPKTISATVAAATVRRDQQALGLRVPATAQTLPPGPNRFHGELGRVAAQSDTHPRFVMGQIIDSVRNGLSFSGIRKVVNIDFAGFALGSVLRARILQISQGFLLLRIDRDRRLRLSLLRLHPAIDVAKLCVAVRMRLAFARLAVGLQTVARRFEQVPHGGRPHGVSLSRQFFRQTPRALAGPPQGRLRIPSTLGFDQPFQTDPDVRVNHVDPFASRSLPTFSNAWRRRTTIQFTDTASNRAVSQTGRRTHRGNTTTPQRHCFHRRPPASRELRQLLVEPSELTFDPLNDAPIHGTHNSVQSWQLMSRPVSSTYLRVVPNWAINDSPQQRRRLDCAWHS